jgi:HlyD family secretion protein
MMRRIVPFFITLGIVLSFLSTLVLLYKKSEAQPIPYRTDGARVMTIVKKTVAPGAIVPRREIVIKSHVSGVVEKLYVAPGEQVKADALIAKIRIIPDAVRVNTAEAELQAAEINFKNAEQELARFEKLAQQKLVLESQLREHRLDYDIRRQQRETAESNLQLVRVGASKKSGRISNLVRATVAGMVLETPMKEGASVIEANNFNEGSTLAVIADVNDMVFQGRVDESEIGRLKETLPVSIRVGALGDEVFRGKLEYISPKGKEREGSIEFEVRATVELKPGVFIRANYSANADIILDQRDNVLAINEGLLAFEKGQTFADIEIGPHRFERRPVKLGLSDGIHVEVLEGINRVTRIKVPGET